MTVAVFIGMLILVGVFFSVGIQTFDLIKTQKGFKLHPTVFLKFLAILLIFLGFTGFISLMMISTGLGSKVPRSFEFPVHPKRYSFTDSKGTIYVPLTDIGRMQVYSPDRKFQYGWAFQTFGGGARVDLIGDTSIQVFTIKRRSLADYDVQGKVRSMIYDASVNSLRDYQDHTDAQSKISSSKLLVTCTSSLAAWATGLLGILIMIGIDHFEKRRKDSAL